MKSAALGSTCCSTTRGGEQAGGGGTRARVSLTRPLTSIKYSCCFAFLCSSGNRDFTLMDLKS